jgi:CelD/BcsL family acetyltransferase involved in cellulose biosynthesis
MLVAAEQERRVIAVAPLFADSGMVFFVGSGGSDYLDFIGDITDISTLSQILMTARQQVDNFVGFRFYHVPDHSPTAGCLQEAARALDLLCFDEGSLAAPVLETNGDLEILLAAANKASLVRHERFLRANGNLAVERFQRGAEIRPHFDDFFEQHVRRWAGTDFPSLFRNPIERSFYGRLAVDPDIEWLRFMVITWNGNPIAYHFGFCYRGVYTWYKPTFAIELARRSPGEVLLRALLLSAREEGASVFDFGLGDEAFKRRFANRVNHVRTWGLYPPEVARTNNEQVGT